ncbi:MAG: hypothetical protein JRN15_07830 [Nitrososphaerota archaeon]|nr:hypothetical protein [Nitrososphaerota archaeon]
MSEEPRKKKYWVSTFYWMKPPPQHSPLVKGFANRQQKKFYLIMQVFKVAQFAAIVLVALFLLGILR